MKKVILLLLTLLFSQLGHSQDHQLGLALRVGTIEQYASKFLALSSIRAELDGDENLIEQIIKNAEDYLSTHPQYRRTGLQTGKDFFSHIAHETKVIARTHGVGVAVFFIAAELAEIPARALFVGIGRPEFIVIMELTRAELTLTFGFVQLKKGLANLKEKRLYSEKGFYKKSKKLRKKFLKEMGLKNEDSTLIGTGDQNIVLYHQTVLNKMLTRIKLSRNLSHLSLKRFLKRQGLYHGDLYRVMIDRDLADYEKVSIVIHKLEADHPLAYEAFLIQFGKIILNDSPTKLSKSTFQWAQRILSSRNTRELQAHFLSYSNELHPFAQVLIWEHAILPLLIDQSHHFRIKEFRKLVKNLVYLKVSAMESLLLDQPIEKETWDLMIKNYIPSL